MTTMPIQFQWDGEAMVPASKYWARQADEQFVVGQRYRMAEENERSPVSHNHEFAWLNEAWQSLPDHMLEQYPSAEHLRKKALIAKGYCTMTQHACMTSAEAERLRSALNAEVDSYAVVIRRQNVVTVYKAVSQSRRAMGGPQFQASKQAILEYVGDLLGVDPGTLGRVEKAA
jgi:hypothetical protein